MGWMDAHEVFVIERAVNDRLDDAERFSLERAFHSEPLEPPSTAASRSGSAATPTTRGPATERACGRWWSPRSSSA
jgi:hypothetical protein